MMIEGQVIFAWDLSTYNFFSWLFKTMLILNEILAIFILSVLGDLRLLILDGIKPTFMLFILFVNGYLRLC